MGIQNYAQTFGTGTANNAGATTVIMAAQGAGKVLSITTGMISITTAATGGGGLVSIKDGTAILLSIDGNSVGNTSFNFGDLGYPGTANTALNLVVEGAVTTQATARLTLVALVRGA